MKESSPKGVANRQIQSTRYELTDSVDFHNNSGEAELASPMYFSHFTSSFCKSWAYPLIHTILLEPVRFPRISLRIRPYDGSVLRNRSNPRTPKVFCRLWSVVRIPYVMKLGLIVLTSSKSVPTFITFPSSHLSLFAVYIQLIFVCYNFPLTNHLF